ncbi:sugar MFS transporter [Neobittarella massiliensis]|uniref:MFS transporter n=1 Tax=Neobittarella massiliensis (ex Bilen et al. 2018) TaxID=2041842 RepID=A0A8J6IFS6_9FIRM|nr:MFS transporter [Neobittarella massiliensis]MBC3516335.1 MFS transporter [Neobittarella massiliensis]
MKNTKKRSVVCIYLMVFMMAFALSINLFGTAQPRIIQGYRLSLEQASMFSVLQSIGMLVSNAIIGLVVDRLDKSRVAGIMCLVMGLILLAIGSMPPFWVLLALFALLGIVSNIVDNACASYMSDLYGDQRSKYISILHAFYGVGAMLGPLYVGFLTDHGHQWSLAYTLLSLLVMGGAIAYLCTLKIMGKPVALVQNTAADGTRQKAPLKAMLASADLRILCIVSFLYAGFQMYTVWLPTYLNQLDGQKYPLSFCAVLLSLFSGGVIVSRLINGIISKFISSRDYITLVSILSGAALIIGLLGQHKILWMAVSFSLGLLTGAIYTAKFVLACEYFPQFPATATAFTGLCTAVGSICFHALTGAVAQRFSFTGAMFIPVCSLLATFLLLILTRKKGKNT